MLVFVEKVVIANWGDRKNGLLEGKDIFESLKSV